MVGCFIRFCYLGAHHCLATTWGVAYLQEAFSLPQANAGNHISVIWWTIAFAGPLVGWLSKRFKTRRWPMLICSAIGAASAFAVLYLPFQSHSVLSLLLVGYGLGASALVIAFGLIVDLQPPEAVGTIVGFTNIAVIFSGLTLLPLAGFIMQRLWQGHMAQGAPIYMHHTFQKALLMLPLCFILAFITSFFVKEMHCKQTHEYW